MKCLLCASICAVLFFCLSPGVLLTLPPSCDKKILMVLKDDKCCATSYKAAAVHAVVFFVLCFLSCYLLRANKC